MKSILQTGFVLTSVFTILSCPAAHAESDTIRDSDNAVWIAGGADWLGYKESVPQPDIPDSERDAIASIAAGGSFLGTEEDIYLALQGTVAFGNASYKGAYLYYPTTPVDSTTQETIATVDAKVGKAFSLADEVMLIPYVDLGYRHWQRNLGHGQEENYENMNALGGLMLQVAPTPLWIITAYGAAGTTLDSQMTTQGLNFKLGDSGIVEVGGKVGYNMTEHVEVFTTLDYDHFNYGQSPLVGGGYYEPNSNTNEANVRVGLSYHFQ